MPDRLTPLDVSFLSAETPTTSMHGGTVATFAPPASGFSLEQLQEVVEQRIGLVPRFRQKVRAVPGRIANPVWVDDEDFDLSYHVRRSALPRPGTDAQLRELVGRLMGRQLDRSRPLWEMYLVEGLSDDRVAVIGKTHQALVDGVEAVDLFTVMLDTSPDPREVPDDDWRPEPAPGTAGLLAGALTDLVRRPAHAAEAARTAVGDVRATAGRVAGVATGVLSGVRALTRTDGGSPLHAAVGQQRRFGMASGSLEDHRRVRAAHGGSVNDVVLATVAGALRTWLLTRGEPVTPTTTVRAVVPVSVRGEGGAGSRVSSYAVDLPVGEGSAVMRLHQVSFAMRDHQESGQAVDAGALVRLSGFAPPTIHALGARAAAVSGRAQLVVANVPGPQFPLYAAGARLLAIHPVVPLARGQAVAIGVTSYDGSVFYGLDADRDAMPDVDVLAQCLEESLAELVGTVAP